MQDIRVSDKAAKLVEGIRKGEQDFNEKMRFICEAYKTVLDLMQDSGLNKQIDYETIHPLTIIADYQNLFTALSENAD